MTNSKRLKEASIWRTFSFWICWAIIVGILFIVFNLKGNGIVPENLYFHLALAGLLPALFVEFKLKGISFQSHFRPTEQKEWKYLLFFINHLLFGFELVAGFYILQNRSRLFAGTKSQD